MKASYIDLWKENTPPRFWLPQIEFPEEVWHDAYKSAFPLLGLSTAQVNIETLLALTLGEARFGSDHWTLSLPKRIYYLLKPALPRPLTRFLRQLYGPSEKTDFNISGPIESRYVHFLWEILHQLLLISHKPEILIKSLWPYQKRFTFVLTHDVETGAGQRFIRAVADLEESLSFRSSFNFVPERYELDFDLMAELRERGFEIGVHGLKHDGFLFSSRATFERRTKRINQYLHEWPAEGFRAPLTHRQPEWMQELDVLYDLSFFDTDPYEPIPGGTMSIWPFFIGHFVELPYTLVQDYTLTSILRETSPRIWLEKVGFIERYHGMALVNTHPDYLKNKPTLDVYYEFLNAMKKRAGYWHALPSEVARWWIGRTISSQENIIPGLNLTRVHPDGKSIRIEP